MACVSSWGLRFVTFIAEALSVLSQFSSETRIFCCCESSAGIFEQSPLTASCWRHCCVN